MINTHSVANYRTDLLTFLTPLEGFRPDPYFDTKGIATIGYGFNIETNPDSRLLVLNQLGLFAGRTDLEIANISEDFRQLISGVTTGDEILLVNALNAKVREYLGAQTTTVFTLDQTQSATVFNQILGDPATGQTIIGQGIVVQGKQLKLDAILVNSVPHDTREYVALMSLFYNAESLVGAGSKLATAVINDNRAEAWYEIRYNSNGGASQSSGIATRRYAEAQLFGLYNGPLINPQPDVAEAKAIFQMYTTHRETIAAYESNPTFAPTTHGALAFQGESFLAREVLVTTYAQFAGAPMIDGEVLVGKETSDLIDEYGSLDLSKNDLIFGEGGNDFVYGHDGADVLYGGAGADRLYGDAGADHLFGGDENDTLTGGLGNDRLEGGAGNDTYYYSNGDGIDTIEDSDATGKIVFNGGLLQGGISTDGGVTYVSLDGAQTYVLSGGHLIVNGVLTVNANFQSGQFGIDLNDLSSYPTDTGAPTGPFTFIAIGGENIDHLFGSLAPTGPEALYGNGGDDALNAGNSFFAFDDLLDGGLGNDTLIGGAGHDYLLGGEGADFGYLTDGDMFVGGSGNDIAVGDTTIANFVVTTIGTGAHYADGGDGADTLMGALGVDVLHGGTGNDTLRGENRPAGWTARIVGLDGLYQDFVMAAYFSPTGAADVLYGEGGADVLVGDGGNDILSGGADNDQLYGDDFADDQAGYLVVAGDDILDGGAGDDLLAAGAGADSLSGGAGIDTLFGDKGDDVLDGGADADTLRGGDGADQLFGGGGDDLIFGDSLNNQFVAETVGGADFLDGGDGNDELQGGVGADMLSGGAGNDLLLGQDDDDTLFGEEGADQLQGGLGNDFLVGDAGNDVLLGDAGDDTLFGGAGVDVLSGGAGADTYVFNLGDGVETIQDTAGEGNRLVFGAGITEQDITLGIGSLLLRVGSNGDAIHIQGFDQANPSNPTGIDRFEFSDGTILMHTELIVRGFDLVGTAGNDVLNGGELYRGIYGLDGHDVLTGGEIDNVLDGGGGQDVIFGHGGADQLSGGAGDDVMRGGTGHDALTGGIGNDSLEGEAGDDVLDGGTGDDQLLGGDGADVYRFNLGDGLDSISDSNAPGEESLVVFGSGITSASLTLTTSFGQVIVRSGTAGDGIMNGANGNDVLGFRSVDLFQFTDGTSVTYTELVARGFDLDGTEFDDFLTGTNVVDRITGGAGSDQLEGGEGSDTYVFNLGDGVDTIVDITSPGAGNEIVFGPGIVSSDLRLDLTPDQSDPSLSDMLLRVGTNGDAVQLDTFDRGDVFGPRTVESFRFDDGSTLTYEQLLARGFDLTGMDSDDQIIGTNVADRIIAGDGADVLRSGAGDDTLEGGLGDDRLVGGQGNDTYVFGPGSGQDAILEFQGEGDTIRMAPGVAPSDVVVTRNNDDLVFSLNGGADQLTVSRYFLAAPLQIELVQFADGTVWDQAFIDDLIQPTITGTAGPDVLVGTSSNDRLAGLAGDDQLTGLTGNDRLDGGTGADQLTGGAGDEIYIVDDAGDVVTELANEGLDTIQSAVTRTLDANVEHLILTSSAAINGTGNALDNVLTGNSAANMLSGGAGNDTYDIGAGDTVVELAGEGTDTVQTGVDTTLGAHVENLTLTGSASLSGTGNELDNVLQADGSISILAGGDGNDTYLIGSNGDDDILVETTTGGIDTVIAAHDYRLPDNIEHLTLLDPQVPDFANFSLVPYAPFALFGVSMTGVGNNLDNTMIGGQTNNLLDGGLGADTMIGGEGDDIYVVDHPNDLVVEQAGEGTDTIQSSITYALSTNVEVLNLTGTASVNGTGNALNNDLRGNEGSNVLDGGAGSDSLQGGGGADTYRFGRGAGQDIVFDVSAAGEIETIALGSDIVPSDIEVYRRDYNLILAITGTTDELALGSFFDQPASAQKQVRFADGTLWNETELRARAVTVGGTILGTTGNDVLTGSAGHDVVIGDAGDDVLTGGLGSDTVYGDWTTPTSFINGQPIIGNDTLIGGGGSDVLIDFRGTNLFDGGSENDTLIVGTGQDTVVFGRGSGLDRVTLDNNGSDLDIIQMGAGLAPTDVVMIRHYPDYHIVELLIPDSGDTLTVTLSTNYPSVGFENTQAVVRFADGTEWNLAWSPPDLSFATGTQLDDDISGFPGDVLRGLAGNDTYSVGAGSGPIIELPGEGIDTVQSTVDYTLSANVDNLFLTDNFTNVGPYADTATGNELDNLIIGNTRDNVLDGGAGNDVLVGGLFRSFEGGMFIVGTGSDILIGGEGDDTLMADGGNIAFAGPFGNGNGGDLVEDVPRQADDLFIGGLGNDTYMLHSSQQAVTEFANEGTDTVRSTVSYMLGEHVESLVLVDPAPAYDENDNLVIPPPLNGTGNDLDNLLIGSGKDNLLTAGVGNDTLWGGSAIDIDSGLSKSGNDILAGGSGHDTYIFKLGDEIDTIEDEAIAGEGNRIQFSEGIAQSDLTFIQDEVTRTLTIQVGSSGMDQLVLTNFDPTGANGSLVVETVTFADGTSASLAALLGLGGPVNHAPTVAVPLTDQTVLEDAPFNLQVPANTFADEDVNDALTYSASLADGTALPTWLSFDEATRTFTGAPDDAQVGSLDLKVTATDTGTLSASDTFTLTVTNVNEIPTVVATITDQTALEDAVFSFTVPTSTFADVDAGDVLTYSATLAGSAALPSWLSFDPATRTFTGTPLNGDVGTLNVAVTATDLGGLSASDTFALAIQNVNDAPTVANPLADQTVLEDAPFSIQMPANAFADEDVGDQLTYSATLTSGAALPSWISFNAATRTFSGTPLNSDVGTLTIAVHATDSGSLNVTDSFALAIQNVNDAPTVAVPLADQQATQGTVFSLVVPTTTFADVDAGDSVTYSATLATGAALPTWLSFDPVTRTFTGTPQAGDVGALDVRVTATDTSALNAADVFALTIAPTGGTPGNDTLIGTSGNDVLDGLAGDDVLQGLAGNDTLIGGPGNDTMQGGLGNDLYIVDVSGDVVTELSNEGTDTVQTALVAYTLGVNVENLTLTGTANLNGTGNALDNILTGNSGINVLTGGAGNDTYVVASGDTVVENAGGGTDRVESTITYTLGSNVEHLTLTGSSAINGTGNTFANVLLGNSAANALTGGGGDDTLDGGDGDDVLDGGTGNDALVGGLGHDMLSGGGNADVLDGGVGNDSLDGGDGNDTLVGGIGDDQLTGGGEADNLDGGEGHDTLNGGAGNDILLAGQGNDILIGGGNADTLDAGDGDDSLDGGAGNDMLLAGAGNDQLIGGGNADTLDGGSGNDILDGVAGDDVLLGGDGDDTLLGGGDHDVLDGGTGNDILEGAAGDDLFHFKSGYGQDTIQNPGGGPDRLQFGTELDPLQLVLSRQVNDLRIAVHGSTDTLTVRDWYTGAGNQTEVLQAGNGQQLLNTQVDQLIQAMAGFTAQTGLTWDQAIDQQPAQVQTVLAASWQ